MKEFKTDAQRLLEQVEKEAAQLKAEKQQKPAHFINADAIATYAHNIGREGVVLGSLVIK